MNQDASISGRRLLITGINGFIGCHLATVAHDRGWLVRGIDVPASHAGGARLRSSLGCPEITVQESSTWNQAELADTLRDFTPNAVIHLAGITARENTKESLVACLEANTVLTVRLIGAIADVPAASRPTFVTTGSQYEYGTARMPWKEDCPCRPTTYYGASKLMATQAIVAAVDSGLLSASVLRLPLVFGPAQQPTMFVPLVILNGLQGRPTKMTTGEQQRIFVYVRDVAHTLLDLTALLSRSRQVRPVINCPGSSPIRIIDIAREIVALFPGGDLLEVGGVPQRSCESPKVWPDTAFASSLGLSAPTTIPEGIASTIDWYRDNSWFIRPAGNY